MMRFVNKNRVHRCQHDIVCHSVPLCQPVSLDGHTLDCPQLHRRILPEQKHDETLDERLVVVDDQLELVSLIVDHSLNPVYTQRWVCADVECHQPGKEIASQLVKRLVLRLHEIVAVWHDMLKDKPKPKELWAHQRREGHEVEHSRHQYAELCN